MEENENQEHQSQRDINEQKVQRHWFNTLPPSRQVEIIKPAFEDAHPSHKDKQDAVRRYTTQTGDHIKRR